MDFQFYPTPAKLARHMWSLFQNRDFVRVLEPSAGDGALIKEAPKDRHRSYERITNIDCCEIDLEKHPLLRELGTTIIGTDFMQMNSGALYSHVILNPPFAQGVHHVLKAWDLIWDGEIVALVNAETVRNPCSKERELLNKLIAQHGSVEFAELAFRGDGVKRETDVEVAIIYLRKVADVQTEIFGNLFDEMQEDHGVNRLTDDLKEIQDLALPNSEIQNRVLAFNASVRTMQEAVKAQARASYYESFLGETMAERLSKGEPGNKRATAQTAEEVRMVIGARYVELKDRAWAQILHSADVERRLSRAGQKRLASEFEKIKRMEFTVSNVYSFLIGLIEGKGVLDMEMMLSCFDEITKYHSDNAVFYRGWKSNDKHRTCGYRIKTTRFILPRFQNKSFGSSYYIDYDSAQRLADFDRVFLMLDGKSPAHIKEEGGKAFIGLADLFGDRNGKLAELAAGARLKTDYFEVRWHPGVGTVHMFPTRKDLVDRLNRMVGQQRKWLPPETEAVPKEFWLQYDKAEKFDAEVRKEVTKACRGQSWWHDPFRGATSMRDETEGARARATLDAALATVQKANGIDIDHLLGAAESPAALGQQTLLLAA